MPANLDEIDHHLLDLLQQDSGRTLAELGDLVGLSPSAVQRRVERYRASGLVRREVAVVDPSAALLAVCLVTLDHESPEEHARFREWVLAAPEVQQLYNVSGDHDYVVVLATTGMPHHRRVADRVLKSAPGLRRYSTMFVLDPVWTSLTVPTRDA
ncbi:Lrp/AsnC family transcriptional regulator [Actinokineospora globicatena]|uniref:Lrp/AsnC family transcriptional regulator n=1 Tax=Actinokineospora globicatena TaxID=103729 RepID=UPI0024A1806C|nr:Lrp/AsnC family transcriptional regulator [Actinokineospora globicatena]MCP2306721.1 DNA-binding transcriptional regulator, Lrp family [Actinokineospora globicatena]GLW82162.1 transcriptional regulator [Actinokineospora globicatena]GLW88955.1 transcriptional regulator [Actinokineospora globicatena]